MRIAVVTETWPPEINGVALTVQSLVMGSLAEGAEVLLIRPRQSGLHSEVENLTDIQVPGLGLPRYPGLRFGLPVYRTILKQLRQQQIQAIYISTEGPLGWAALKAAKKLNLPILTGFHTRFDHYMKHYGLGAMLPVAESWLKKFHNQATATLVPTHELKSELDEKGYQHVELLERAVDTHNFSPGFRSDSLRNKWGVQSDEHVVMHVGRLASEKNLDLIVEAYRAMQQKKPKLKMVWVGDGPARAAIEEQNPDMIFCGMQRDRNLAEHFASGDIFLFPSVTETFGNVTLEAMASGLPVLAFNYGAAKQHIIHGETGFLAEFGDHKDFVQQAVSMLSDLESLPEIGTAANLSIAHLAPAQVSQRFLQMMNLDRNQEAA